MLSKFLVSPLDLPSSLPATFIEEHWPGVEVLELAALDDTCVFLSSPHLLGH